MFLAVEPQVPGVYFSLHAHGLFVPSEHLIRHREIALRDENYFFWCAKPPLHRQLGLVHGQRVFVVFCNV